MSDAQYHALQSTLLDALEQEIVGEANTPALIGRVRLLLKGTLYQAGIRNPVIHIEQYDSVIDVRIRYQAGPKQVRTLRLSTTLM